jgi:hypothetical protein
MYGRSLELYHFPPYPLSRLLSRRAYACIHLHKMRYCLLALSEEQQFCCCHVTGLLTSTSPKVSSWTDHVSLLNQKLSSCIGVCLQRLVYCPLYAHLDLKRKCTDSSNCA